MKFDSPPCASDCERRPTRPRLERIARPFASWSCLAAGLSLMALILLTPSWLELSKLSAQRDKVKAAAQVVSRQLKDNRHLRESLRSNDPFVLEHLAYHYLGLKPRGTESLNQVRFPGVKLRAAAVPAVLPTAPWSGAGVETRLGGTRQIGHARWKPPADGTQLVRLATGPHRVGVLGLAGVCIVFGLVVGRSWSPTGHMSSVEMSNSACRRPR